MVRLFFYVEGQTEQLYVRQVLKPHLEQFEVYVTGAILAGYSRRRGVTYRGGSGRYQSMRRDLSDRLKEHGQSDVRFTTMFDLYALHDGFPGQAEAGLLRDWPEKRVACLETAFAADINDRRLLPHIQLHEFETILFCDPEAFRLVYPSQDRPVAALHAVLAAEPNPERINDGPLTAPSKRIAAHFPGYPRSKVSTGVSIASSIDLGLIRSKCPHFDRWITRLESLGRPAT